MRVAKPIWNERAGAWELHEVQELPAADPRTTPFETARARCLADLRRAFPRKSERDSRGRGLRPRAKRGTP